MLADSGSGFIQETSTKVQHPANEIPSPILYRGSDLRDALALATDGAGSRCLGNEAILSLKVVGAFVDGVSLQDLLGGSITLVKGVFINGVYLQVRS